MEGPHATASSFMHIGDRITLFHELSNGYLGAEGFSNTQVAIDVDDGIVAGDKTRSESRDAIFVVHGAANYNATMKIKAYQAKNGMTMDEVQSDPACRTLLLEKAKEDKLNLEEFEQSTGKPVRYGMVVQLQHDTSHKFIVVTRESAELNRDGRRVMLDGNAGEGAWFKIMPRLRVHSEGEKIHVDDPVMLESVDSNLRLSADPHAQLADGRKECSAAQNGSTFKLDLYRSYDMHRRAQQTLMGGQAVRLIHKEAEGYIGSDHRRAQLGLPVYVQNAEVMHKHGSSNTIWLIEKSTPGKVFDGNTCLWEDQYRLRHLPTGRLLAVIMEPSEMEAFNQRSASGASPRATRSAGGTSIPPGKAGAKAGGKGGFREGEGAQGGVARRGTMLRASDHYSPDTLFHLVPQYPREGAIGIEMHLRMRHVVSGMWLHVDIQSAGDLTPAQKARVEEERALRTELLLRRGAELGRKASSPTVGLLSGLGKVAEDMVSAAATPPPAQGMPPSATVGSGASPPSPPRLPHPMRKGTSFGSVGKAMQGLTAKEQVLAADEKESHFPSLGGRPLVATTNLHDEDVFGIQLVPQEIVDDVVYVNSCATIFHTFLAQFAASPLPHRAEVDLAAITAVLTDMILFVTVSDNPDPNTREGLPHPKRQLLLRDQQILDLTMQCVIVPFKKVFSFEDFRSERSRRKPENVAIHSMAVLAQRLARHILRDCTVNKTYAVRFVGTLQSQLSFGIMAAPTLTEIFADNEDLLEKVDDQTVLRFIDLLREQARLARFVNFLAVLCQCAGKSVRPNQWRVCRMLCEQAPELLLKLSLQNGRVMVSGDPRFFPMFAEVSEYELCAWLDSTAPENAAYFERLMALYSGLVRGRNLKNTPKIAALLPYELCFAIITDRNLHRNHLDVSTQFVGIARDLYIDNEPNEVMTRVKPVRIWANVQAAAASGKLSSRLTTVLDIDWRRYDGLKTFAFDYLNNFYDQRATDISQNQMALQLLRSVYHLLEGGFYTAEQVVHIRAPLLKLLDGRGDKVGLDPEHELPEERYAARVTIKVNTVVIMECKSELCKILQLICTMRLDIRLSQLLARYETEWAQGTWEAQVFRDRAAQHGLSDAGSAVGGGNQPPPKPASAEGAHWTSRVLGRGSTGGYTRLVEEPNSPHHFGAYGPTRGEAASGHADRGMSSADAAAAKRDARRLRRSREEAFERTFAVLPLDGGALPDLVEVCMDLTFYQHKDLVSQALGLLVRHFEQRRVLRDTGLQVQLLVKPTMVGMYTVFDQVLRKLRKLASRRRLFDDELYQATRLMGTLTMHCYEEAAGSAGRSAASRQSRSRTAGTDHTAGIYLQCIGKAACSIGLALITLQPPEPGEEASHPLRQGERLQLANRLYTVRGCAADGLTVTLDAPIQFETEAQVPAALRAGGDGVVWVFKECRSAGPNADMQMLLMNLKAHEPALQLLRLPFDPKEERPEEQSLRALLRAAYRLLKAMCTQFSLMQAVLVEHVRLFVGHTEARLISHDISPTDCINAVYLDNRAVCTQVDEATVRNFTKLAAHEQAPRFLRFLRMVSVADGAPLPRNQCMVLQALSEREAALLLFKTPEGRAERARMIEADEHVHRPRGRLAYHIELVGLLGACALGKNAAAEMMVRDLLPLDELIRQITMPGLPMQLRANYLCVLREAYLETERGNKEVGTHPALMGFLGSLRASIEDLVKVLVEPGSNILEEEAQLQTASYVCCEVLPTLQLYYKSHYSSPSTKGESRAPQQRGNGGVATRGHEEVQEDDVAYVSPAMFGEELAQLIMLLGQEAAGLETVLPPKAVADCLEAMASANLCAMSAISPASPKQLGRPDSAGMGALVADEGPEIARDLPEIAGDLPLPEIAGDYPVFGRGSGPLAAEEPHPQETLREFFEVFGRMCGVEEESSGLVAVFTEGMDGGADGEGRRAGRAAGESVGEKRTKNMVEQLVGSRARTPAEGEAIDLARTTASLRVLTAILDESGATRLHSRQQMLTKMGGARLALMLACCEVDELALAGLRLGLALLKGGNTEVQLAMHEALLGEGDRELRPYDGSSGSFLAMMRYRLRLGAKEIHERKFYLAQQVERRATFAEDTQGLSSAAVVALRAQLEADFPARAFVVEVLELLRLMCEGHNQVLQDFLVEQPGLQDIDLVSEVYTLLAHLEPEIDSSTIHIVHQCADALTEFVQGNVSRLGPAALLDTKLLEVLNRLVHRLHFGEGVSAAEGHRLRARVAVVLMALLEGTDRAVEDRMVRVLDLHRIGEVAADCYAKYREKQEQDSTVQAQMAHMLRMDVGGRQDHAEQAAKEDLLAAGFSLYIILHHLLDYLSVDDTEAHSYLSGLDDEARAFYGRYVARLEIVNAVGELERVYFRFPEICLLVPDESKQELLWSVDRHTPGKRTAEFFEASADLYLEMCHQEKLLELSLWRTLLRWKPLATRAVLAIAIVQNVLILLRSGDDDSRDADGEPSTSASGSGWRAALAATLSPALGCVQVLASVVICALHVLQNAPLQQRRMWRQLPLLGRGRSYEDLLARACDLSPHGLGSVAELCYKLQFWLASFGFLLMDGHGLFCTACVGAALLGIVHSPFWFAFHLLDVSTKSKDLQNVFKAVTQNGRSIMMTALFGVIIVYIYAILGYVYLRDAFAVGDYPDEDIPMCTNLPDCWVGALSEGLRGGDIGGFMDPRKPTDPKFYAQVAYQLSFWAIVITILLNVIFGIIIDTFGELRADHLAKKHDMENTCFVCGVDRFTLDTKGGGFERHIKEDHYMWNYLYLIVHLRVKPPTEYNGWEQHVAHCLAQGETSFIPVNSAISLSEHKKREAAEEREQANRLLDIQAKAGAASEAALKVCAALERTERQLSGVEGSGLGSVLERVDELREMLRSGARSDRPLGPAPTPPPLRPAGSAAAAAAVQPPRSQRASEGLDN